MTQTDWLALGTLALSSSVFAIQAVHYLLSLANARAIEQLKAQIAVQLGDLRVYMHEKFVTKDELEKLVEQLEQKR